MSNEMLPTPSTNRFLSVFVSSPSLLPLRTGQSLPTRLECSVASMTDAMSKGFIPSRARGGRGATSALEVLTAQPGADALEGRGFGRR
jgi:hypothetical protein